jgi:hypothetical protein
MAESEPVAGKEIFDNLSKLLRDIRFKAYEKDDRDISNAVDRAEALLGDFAAAVGEEVGRLTNILIMYRELALKKADAALRGYQKANLELESITMDAIAGIEVALEKWP